MWERKTPRGKERGGCVYLHPAFVRDDQRRVPWQSPSSSKSEYERRAHHQLYSQSSWWVRNSGSPSTNIVNTKWRKWEWKKIEKRIYYRCITRKCATGQCGRSAVIYSSSLHLSCDHLFNRRVPWASMKEERIISYIVNQVGWSVGRSASMIRS